MLSKLSIKRIQMGYTQEHIAKILGIAVSTYSQYESANRNVPAEIANKISEILDIDVNTIFLPVKFTVSK